MEKEQRDLNWKCLPKGTRDFIKCQLKAKSDCPDFDEGYDQALIDLFGKPNLESDTEPSELLFVERKKVVEYCAEIKKYEPTAEPFDRKARYIGQLESLYHLFGDKCLPDKIQDTGFGGMNLTPPACKLDVKPEQPSVQCEPKFKFKYDIDDKVLLKGSDKPMFIRQRVGFKDYDNGYQITTLDTRYPQWVKESDLEPYTEPETEDNTQQNGWDEDFKKMNECFEKIQKTLSSLCDTFGKLEANVNKLETLMKFHEQNQKQ